MAQLFRDIVAFIGAVLRQWVVLMGGVIMTVITLIERERGNNISPRIYWPIIIGFVLVAIFLAWRNERRQWERLTVTTLSATPKDLTDAYVGRTDVQGEALAATYRGKWLRVSGTLGNVSVHRTGLKFGDGATVTFEGRLYPTVFMNFNRRWIHRLSMLGAGETITVLGQVRKVERYSVWLKNCELLDIPAVDAGSVESGIEEADQTASSQNTGSMPSSKID